jgi:hypothetical protein
MAALLRVLLDAPALEALLRGLVRRDAHGRILATTWPTPGLGPELLAELASLPGPERLPDVLARRGSPLAPAAAAAVAAARAEPRLIRAGVALQRTVVEGARAEVAGRGEDARVTATLLAAHVDHVNTTTLLAAVSLGDAAELFVPGGRLDAAAFVRLASMAPERRRARAAVLAGSAAGARRLDPELLRDPAVSAQLLSHLRERLLHRMARAFPHSVAVPLSALAERAGEARRLRILLLGAEHGLPPDLLLDLVEA